jgi:hypothetical protein
MNTKYKSKLSNLQFVKLDQKKAVKEMRKILDTHLNLELTSKNVFKVDFIGRKFIFALTSQYSNGSLLRNLVSLKGILGIILAYDRASNGYLTDKIVASEPLSSKKLNLMILNLRGETLFSGTGSVRKLGIDFTIKGRPSEGQVRTTISGMIGSSNIIFADSVMPNRIYKKQNQPHPELQKNILKE